jgi:hypothetical protein
VSHLHLAREDDGVDGSADDRRHQPFERRDVRRHEPFIDAQLVERRPGGEDRLGERRAALAVVHQRDACPGQRDPSQRLDALAGGPGLGHGHGRRDAAAVERGERLGPARDNGGADERLAHLVQPPESRHFVEHARRADAGQEDHDVIAADHQRLDPRLHFRPGLDRLFEQRRRAKHRRALALEHRRHRIAHAGLEHGDGPPRERTRQASLRLPRHVVRIVAHGQHHLAFCIDRDRIRPKRRAGVAFGFAGPQAELVAMQRADHLAVADHAIGERPSEVGAPRLRGVHGTAARAKHRHVEGLDSEHATFTRRNAIDRTQVHPAHRRGGACAHRLVPLGTSSTGTNCDGCTGAVASCHGST